MVGGGGSAWRGGGGLSGGMHGRGGVCIEGESAWRGYMEGVCVEGSLHGGGSVWGVCMEGQTPSGI